MSISYTYDTLVQALQDHNEDSFTDFVSELPDLVGKAELRVLRDLDLDLFDQVDTSVVTIANTPTISLAADAIMLRSLWVNGVFCQPRSESFIYHYDDVTSAGQPLYWNQVTEETIRLAPRPDVAYSTRQRVMKRPTGLSSGFQTTWVSEHVGDLLFWACMVQAENFSKATDTGDATVAEAEYQKLLPMAQQEVRLMRRREYA